MAENHNERNNGVDFIVGTKLLCFHKSFSKAGGKYKLFKNYYFRTQLIKYFNIVENIL